MHISIDHLSSDAEGALFDSALQLRRDLKAEYDPDLDADTEELFRGAIAGSETFVLDTLVATFDGAAVGIALVHLDRLGNNEDQAEVELEVHPDHRRRGVGTVLLSAVVELAAADGRTSLTGFNVDSPDAAGFWAAQGAEKKMIDRQSRMWLADTDETLMREWVDAHTSRAGDYRLEHFKNITPPNFRAAVARLHNAMNDAPIDDLDREPDLWTEDDVVALDELVIGRGRERWTTIALGPNDEPAGLTTISIQSERPRFAHQGNTAVATEHRQRGIGRWLKADMWLRLRNEAPFVEAVDTENAESNSPMLSINEAMGFAPLLAWGVWQADLSTLRAASSS